MNVYMTMPMAIVFVAIGGVACTKQRPPQWTCADPAVLDPLKGTFFSGANRRMDANAVDNPMVDWAAVKRELQTLKADNLFSIAEIVFEGQDKETKAIRCNAVVHITLPDRYRKEAFLAKARLVQDPETPADLFGDQPSVSIQYAVQPDVTGKTYVLSSDTIGPLVASLVVLSATKWQTAMSDP